jgi:hypothetical protein
MTGGSPFPNAGPNWRIRVVECPRCAKPLVFCRASTLNVDSCGFESYRLDCPECDAKLAGIVDPFDEALMVCLLDKVAR